MPRDLIGARARAALRVVVMLAAVALVLLGALALFGAIARLFVFTGPSCSPCWSDSALYGWIAVTFFAVAAIATKVARDAASRGGDKDAFASAGLGATIAIAVGFLAPFWGPWPLPPEVVAVLLVAVLGGFFLLPRVINRSKLHPEWAWILAAYGLVRLILLPLAPQLTGSEQHVTEDIFPWWSSLGAVPLAVGLLLYPLGGHESGMTSAPDGTSAMPDGALVPAIGSMALAAFIFALVPGPSNVAVGGGALAGMLLATVLWDRIRQRPMFWRRPGSRWSTLQWTGLAVATWLAAAVVMAALPVSDFLGLGADGQPVYHERPDRLIVSLGLLWAAILAVDAVGRALLRWRRARDIRAH